MGFLAQVIVGFETASLARSVGPFLWLLGVPAIGAGLFLDMPALLSGGAWLLLSATLLAGVNVAGLLGLFAAGGSEIRGTEYSHEKQGCSITSTHKSKSIQRSRCHVLPVLQRGQMVGLLTPENVGEFVMFRGVITSPLPAGR